MVKHILTFSIQIQLHSQKIFQFQCFKNYQKVEQQRFPITNISLTNFLLIQRLVKEWIFTEKYKSIQDSIFSSMTEILLDQIVLRRDIEKSGTEQLFLARLKLFFSRFKSFIQKSKMSNGKVQMGIIAKLTRHYSFIEDQEKYADEISREVERKNKEKSQEKEIQVSDLQKSQKHDLSKNLVFKKKEVQEENDDGQEQENEQQNGKQEDEQENKQEIELEHQDKRDQPKHENEKSKKKMMKKKTTTKRKTNHYLVSCCNTMMIQMVRQNDFNLLLYIIQSKYKLLYITYKLSQYSSQIQKLSHILRSTKIYIMQIQIQNDEIIFHQKIDIQI